MHADRTQVLAVVRGDRGGDAAVTRCAAARAESEHCKIKRKFAANPESNELRTFHPSQDNLRQERNAKCYGLTDHGWCYTVVTGDSQHGAYT